MSNKNITTLLAAAKEADSAIVIDAAKGFPTTVSKYEAFHASIVSLVDFHRKDEKALTLEQIRDNELPRVMKEIRKDESAPKTLRDFLDSCQTGQDSARQTRFSRANTIVRRNKKGGTAKFVSLSTNAGTAIDPGTFASFLNFNKDVNAVSRWTLKPSTDPAPKTFDDYTKSLLRKFAAKDVHLATMPTTVVMDLSAYTSKEALAELIKSALVAYHQECNKADDAADAAADAGEMEDAKSK